MIALASSDGKPKRLPPVRPNAGVRARYEQALAAIVSKMAGDVAEAIRRTWQRKPPAMANDESSPAALRAVMAKMGRDWERNFSEFASTRGRKFTEQSAGMADKSFMAGLREAGFTVRLQMTRAVNETIQAAIAEQVALIKSIPAQYLTQVEGAVMRSVEAGMDISGLMKEIQEQTGVTRRRAAFIARDQNNKVSAFMERTRQVEYGITQAEWLHSGGGKHPRPEHVAFSGKLYDVAKGAYLEGKWVWPGTEINCRCVSVSVVPGIKR